MFIPPVDIGAWKPSPGTLSEWIYQIWQYLKANPIASKEQITEYISEIIGSDISEQLPEVLPDELDKYFEDNPIDFPVTSVNEKIGAVLLELADIVETDSMLPVVSLANDEADQEALIEAFENGARFCLIDEESLSIMLPTYGTGNAVTAISLLPVATGGGEGGDFSPISLTIGSGTKTLNAGGTVAFTLGEIGAASTADLTTLGGRVTALESYISSMLGVGAIYITKDSTFNPNNVFPGSWHKLENVFIYGADNNTTVDDTIRGESDVTLNLTQIPPHTHNIRRRSDNASQNGNCLGSVTNTNYVVDAGYGAFSAGGSNGVTQSHNNMPPYMYRYIWERYQ